MREVQTVDEALSVFFDLAERGRGDDLFAPAREDDDGLLVGQWATLAVRLPTYDAEMPSPFLDAYSEIQASLYRFAAFIEHGNADKRSLTFANFERYQLVVKVEDGSAKFTDNIPEILTRLGEAAIAQMDGTEATITILGLGLLVAGSWGFKAYLQHKKEVRVDEVHAEERKELLEAMKFATEEHSKQMNRVLGILEGRGAAAHRAVITAREVNDELLKAAAQVDETEVSDVHLSRAEAKELRGSIRRRSSTAIVEVEMRVVDVNVADPANTTVILEDIDSQQQHRVTFSDATIEAEAREIVFEALEQRGTAIFKIVEKSVEGDVVSVNVMSVRRTDHSDEPEVVRTGP